MATPKARQVKVVGGERRLEAAKGEAVEGLGVVYWIDEATLCDWHGLSERSVDNYRDAGLPHLRQPDRSVWYPIPHANIWCLWHRLRVAWAGQGMCAYPRGRFPMAFALALHDEDNAKEERERQERELYGRTMKWHATRGRRG